jgi:hypothetical protein
MNEPIELVAKGTDEVIAYACAECKCVWKQKHLAVDCCNKWCKCGGDLRKGYSLCEKCGMEFSEKVERRRFDDAEKVSWREYDGPVFFDGKYWESVDAFSVSFDGEYPKYLWACYKFGLTLDAGKS